MRVAIVHDWLVVYAGAERVLEQMLACYPDADLFSLVDFLPALARTLAKSGPSPITTKRLSGMALKASTIRSIFL